MSDAPGARPGEHLVDRRGQHLDFLVVVPLQLTGALHVLNQHEVQTLFHNGGVGMHAAQRRAPVRCSRFLAQLALRRCERILP